MQSLKFVFSVLFLVPGLSHAQGIPYHVEPDDPAMLTKLLVRARDKDDSDRITRFYHMNRPSVYEEMTPSEPGLPGSLCDLQTCTYVPDGEKHVLETRDFGFTIYRTDDHGDKIDFQSTQKKNRDVRRVLDNVNKRQYDDAGRDAKLYIEEKLHIREYQIHDTFDQKIVVESLDANRNVKTFAECSLGKPFAEELFGKNKLQCTVWYQKVHQIEDARELRKTICEQLTHNHDPKNENCSSSTLSVVNYARKMRTEHSCIRDQ